MNVSEVIEKRRTIRKFKQTPIDADVLRELVRLASLSASAANLQPLKYKISTDEKIFDTLKWAGYLKDGAPKEGERPVAYIAVLGDSKLSKNPAADAGAAITTLMLAAAERGIGTCWFGSVDRTAAKKILEIPEEFDLLYMIALGYPAQENSVCEAHGDIKYFEDGKGGLVVPKRPLSEILL